MRIFGFMSDAETTLEHWLRGPVEGVHALLQPVAHALLQANSEIQKALKDFPEELIWENVAGMASVGFHLQHIPGVLDRLLTYSEEKHLSMQQLKYLSEEGLGDDNITLAQLLQHLDAQIHDSLAFLRNLDISILTNARFVGRKRLPSTVMGLIFHSAEHAMRHTGQLLVTARVVASTTIDGVGV